MSQITEPDGSFRDSLATIDAHGRRLWVYPHKPKGTLHRARAFVAVMLLAFLFAAPFIKAGGSPLMLFDVVNRKFFIFGITFFPQDFHLLVLSTIALVVFTLLFTAAYGRLFCGWICPQTIFLEMVFRKIEFLIEGGGPSQRKLAAAPLDGVKFIRKAVKHVLFLLVAAILSHTFLAYFLGSDRVLKLATSSPAHNLVGFILMLIFTLVFYGIYARFREQICTLVCPYGRLQSVLLDTNSVVVSYDHKRGEPRARRRKSESREGKGDCVECSACVNVCPTGIDIRNGTQLECINCAACIDACNRTMDAVGLPRKLIRYASQDEIEGKSSGFRFTPRIAIYSTVFLALVATITILTAGRSPVEATILRTTGQTYEELADGNVRNLYTIKILNRLPDSAHYELRLAGMQGQLEVVGPKLVTAGFGNASSVFAVTIPKEQLFSKSTLLTIAVTDGETVLEEVRTSFFGPGQR